MTKACLDVAVRTSSLLEVAASCNMLRGYTMAQDTVSILNARYGAEFILAERSHFTVRFLTP
jgi:hypothetical protein